MFSDGKLFFSSYSPGWEMGRMGEMGEMGRMGRMGEMGEMGRMGRMFVVTTLVVSPLCSNDFSRFPRL
jgi:hypothetical protein